MRGANPGRSWVGGTRRKTVSRSRLCRLASSIADSSRVEWLACRSNVVGPSGRGARAAVLCWGIRRPSGRLRHPAFVERAAGRRVVAR